MVFLSGCCNLPPEEKVFLEGEKVEIQRMIDRDFANNVALDRALIEYKNAFGKEIVEREFEEVNLNSPLPMKSDDGQEFLWHREVNFLFWDVPEECVTTRIGLKLRLLLDEDGTVRKKVVSILSEST